MFKGLFLNINFQKQKIFDSCLFPDTKCYGYYDFYIEDSFLLEFDGKQHFISVDGWGGEEGFQKRLAHDEYKNKWAKENNIPLKRIPYWKLDTITLEDIMGDEYLV